MLDAEAWMKDMEARVAETQRKAEAMTAELANTKVTTSSADGSVTITVNPNGGLGDLQLGPRACDLGHTKLTALIMQTYHRAQKEITKKVVASFQEAFPDSTQSLDMMLNEVPYDLEDDSEDPQQGWHAAQIEEPEPEPTRRAKPSRPKPAPPTRRPLPADDEDELTDRPW